jgi:hypothetical protein
MDPIVQAAGTALVQAITTDAWQQVKQAVIGLWRRVHPESAGQIGDDLDKLRQQMRQAQIGGDAGTERALEGLWQMRLQELLWADPALGADLQQALNQIFTPALPAPLQARIGTILMTGTSHDSSTFTQIGTQIIYGQP